MAPDDRNFEKALSRHLRSEPAFPETACADSESLAAYHERLLSPSELASWKEHIAGCTRCQQILEALETSERVPLDLGRERQAELEVVVESSGPARAERDRVQPIEVAAAKSRRRVIANWRYAVPAGAIAAGLLVWIVARESHLEPAVVERPNLPVSDRSASVPADAAKTNRASEVAKTLPESKLKQPSLTPQAENAGPRADASQADQKDLDQEFSLKSAPLRDGFAVPTSHPPQQKAEGDRLRNRRKTETSANRKEEAQSFDELDMPAAEARAQIMHVAPTPPAPPPPPPSAEAVGGVAEKRSRQTKPAAAAPAPQSARSAPVLARSSVTETAGPRIFPVPGSKVLWRIDELGSVDRSEDLGETWSAQDTGVSATRFAGLNPTLLSGSAPSENVCWLVGTFGTVLLTTDAGLHWTKLAAPATSTIDRIEASDARHAVVTLQSTTIQFATSDGGQSWSAVKKR
jgi:hypothetical protein